MITPGERALLFCACWNHPVATCEGCHRSLEAAELAAWRLCPVCGHDLTSSIREHLIACSVAAILGAQHVVAEAKALSEESAGLRKEAQRLCDASAVVRAEAEAVYRTRPGGQLPSADGRDKDWDIEAQSYKSESGRWRPKAFVITVVAGSFRTHSLPAPLDVAFDSEAEANAYAVVMAQEWIDARG